MVFQFAAISCKRGIVRKLAQEFSVSDLFSYLKKVYQPHVPASPLNGPTIS